MEELWKLLEVDLDDMLRDEGESCETVDQCIDYMVAQCNLRLGIQCDPSLIMANIAHLLPHVLAPNVAAAHVCLLCGRMIDVLGRCGSVRLRHVLARGMLRIPGEARELQPESMLQDRCETPQQMQADPCRHIHTHPHTPTHTR